MSDRGRRRRHDNRGADSPRVNSASTQQQPEALCCRCGKAPVAYVVRPHRVGLCGPCYLDNLGLVAAVPA